MKKNSRLLALTPAVVASLGLAAASVLMIAPARAGDAESAAAMSSDQLFVFKATQDGLAEVQLGELAQKRSKDPMVKTFAAMMVKDHAQAGEELKALAEKKGWKVPTSLDGEHAKMVHSLSAKPDSEFDAEYSRQMMEAHEKAVILFQDAAAVSDKELAAFAKKTLPVLQKHKQQASMLPAKRPEAPTVDRDPLDRNIEGRNSEPIASPEHEHQAPPGNP